MGGVNNDRYQTVAFPATAEIVVKKSRFIGLIYPVQTKEEAMIQYHKVCKLHHSAHHNCYAYSVGVNVRETKTSDDGEPSGTAGRPIMDIIRKYNLTNVLIIVTRYFGGIKLGTSGLVKAYSAAAEATVLAGEIIEKYLTRKIELTCEYKQLKSVEATLKSVGATILKSDYVDIVSLLIEVRLSAVELLKNKLTNIFKGSLNYKELD